MHGQIEHTEKGGGECPLCGSGDIEGESFDHYGSFVVQKISCNDCHARWEDYFTLTHYEVLEKGEHHDKKL